MSVEALLDYKEKVDRELRTFFEAEIEKTGAVHPLVHSMMETLAEYTLRGGKRIRAAMVYYGHKCFSDDNLEEVVKASMVIELMQSYLLIHDDWMDKDDMRRGGPAVHKTYQDLFQREYPGQDTFHLSESLAVLAGDALQALSFELMAGSKFDSGNLCRAINALAHTATHVVYGQVLDLLASSVEADPEYISKVRQLKTASYTFEGPLHIGAALAGAGDEEMRSLSAYATPLGEAFQLQDDILGLYGDEQKVGKPIGSDLVEGKRTLLILNALEKTDSVQTNMIQQALGNPDLTLKQLEQVRNIVRDTGSLEYSQDLARRLISDAKRAIVDQSWKKEGKDFLLWDADYMLQRDF